MDIRIIAFGMVAVLALLFIGARFFVPREKNNSRLEAAFAQAALQYKASPNEAGFKACFEAAKDLPHLKNKDEQAIKDYLSGQGISAS